jgi:hypothetical protein
VYSEFNFRKGTLTSGNGKLLDHAIIGEDSGFSLTESGLMDEIVLATG